MCIAVDVLPEKFATHRPGRDLGVIAVVACPFCKVIRQVKCRGAWSRVLVVDKADSFGIRLCRGLVKVSDYVGA